MCDWRRQCALRSSTKNAFCWNGSITMSTSSKIRSLSCAWSGPQCQPSRQPKTKEYILLVPGNNTVWQVIRGGKLFAAFGHLLPMSAKGTQSRSAAANAAPDRFVSRACLASRPQWTIGLSSRTVWRARHRANLLVRRRDLSRQAISRPQRRWTSLHCVSDQPRVGVRKIHQLTEWNARRRVHGRLSR